MRQLSAEIMTVTKPVPHNPFMSERIDVVRLSDYVALLDQVETFHKATIENLLKSRQKTSRFKHPRFIKGKSYWEGALGAWSMAEFKLKMIVKSTRKVENDQFTKQLSAN